MYKIDSLCVCVVVVCVSVLSSLCTATVLSGTARHLAYPTDRHVGLASAARARELALSAPSIYAAANDWRAP